jgi:hypothetical protein
MPISNKHKFKFIHIPKTGGSSVEVVFDLQHDENLWVPRFTHKIQECNFAPQHFTHALINHFKPNCKDYFSFAIVRNPYDRIISEYFYINKSFEGKPISNFNEDQFNIWLDTNLIKFDIDHKLPQTLFLDVPVDMILKLENINKDWEKLNERLGVNIKLIHDNKSSINKKDIVDSLSKKTKQKIYKIFKDDFEKLNYESNI